MNKKFKIYTKTGDKGETSLIGGARVPKDHVQVEAYGSVDELNSFLGLLRDEVKDDHLKDMLLEIQRCLFVLEAALATPPEGVSRRMPELTEEQVRHLETEIDRMEAGLPELTSFILPGGHPQVSLCHVARTVCRRAERRTLTLARESKVDDIHLRYLNRLADYLFVLARKLGKDNQAGEVIWKETH
ncbi:MAG: cob(I)yrinic acid a,c-diamide adenosyltransferase [Bacteroidetes bacterium]|nr:cob(I)yrinic acid a,c-diamide adenosyltransferase [Bacteroidota bacterium]